MTRSLLEYEILSFDCYGTLIDWESGLWTALRPLMSVNEAVVTRPDALKEFGRLEASHEAETPDLPYPEILTTVHRDLARSLGLTTTDELDRAFGASVPEWPAFPDSAQALTGLGAQYRLVVLSNVDRRSFAASNRRLGVSFDAVYTAEDIGSYKPDPANFTYLLQHLEDDFGIGPDSVLHVAQSLYHDHGPAKAAGLDTAWIDRQRLSLDGEWGATMPVEELPIPDHVFFSMAELSEAVEAS